MMTWIFWLACGLVGMFLARVMHDRPLFQLFSYGTAFFVVVSILIGALNYIQLGRVFL